MPHRTVDGNKLFNSTRIMNKEGWIVLDKEQEITTANIQANTIRAVEIPVKTKSNAKIGIFLQRFKTGEKHCASDRIRGKWVAMNSKDMEIWDDRWDYEAVIFHRPCQEISEYNGIKILDICDDIWKAFDGFDVLISGVDAITVPTKGMKDALKEVTDKEVRVIPDGHNFDHYKTRVPNKHTKRAKTAVWFGYAKNFYVVKPLLKEIKKQGLKLKVITQCPVGAGKFVKWDIKTYIKEISKCDFAILPTNGKLKSDNKTITALLSGIPVAKTAKDIKYLMNPKNRRKEMEKTKKILPSYSSKLRTRQYLRLIDRIRKTKPIIYTSVKGGYESKRYDIKSFADDPTDKFKQPVMNAKIYKVLPHKFFDAECSIWVDGNVYPTADAKTILKMLGDADIAVFSHPYRKCVYKEAPEARKRVAEENKALIDEQIDNYHKEGMPHDFGLWECGMILRRHNAATEEFGLRWWAEICRYSERDQLSFPYVLWKMADRIKLKTLKDNVRSHKYFRYANHNSQRG